MTREPIFQALFAKLSAVAGMKTVSRKLKHWSDVTAGEQPALFQAQKMESITRTPGLGARHTLYADIYVYVKTTGSASPSTQMNGIIDAIEAALEPDNPIKNKNTLGGLVEHCAIEGSIETDEGTLGDQAVAIIPIVIFTA